MMAIVGLEYRSSVQHWKLQDAIEQDATVRTIISATPAQPPEQLVLENIIN